MKEQFVTYEIALKLKELGFDEECFGVYYDYKGDCKLCFDSLFSNKDIIIHTDEHSYCALCLAPLWQQVIDWFRETNGIDIEIPYGGNPGKYYAFAKGYIYDKYDKNNPEQFTYNEAREQAILKAIELCK